MSFIDTDLIEKHVFFSKPLKKNTNTSTSSFKTKKYIQLYDEICINHIHIIELIEKIQCYSNEKMYFLPSKIEFIDVSSQDDYEYVSHKIIQKKQKQVLFTYKTQEKIVPFINYLLYSNHNPKNFIMHLHQSYITLVNNLIKLEMDNICFFGLSSKNILYDIEKSNILLQNFSSAFMCKHTDTKKNFINSIKNLDKFAYQPLEIHLIYFLLNNPDITLSYYQVEEISQHYIDYMPIFSLFSDLYKENYKHSCVNILSEYINKTSDTIIEKILKYSHTWCNFSLTILYLYLVENMIQSFSLRGKDEDIFLSGWLELLRENLNPDPLKRNTLEITKKKLEKLYYDFPSWSFVNAIPVENMEKLIEALSG